MRTKDELLRAIGQELPRSSAERAEVAVARRGGTAGRVEGALRAELDLILDLAARSEHAVELLAAHAKADPEGSNARTATIGSSTVTAPAHQVLGERAQDIAVLPTRCAMGLETDLATPDPARARLRLLVQLVGSGLPS